MLGLGMVELVLITGSCICSTFVLIGVIVGIVLFMRKRSNAQG
ncbi:MAG: hypothetical protein AAFX99_34980 [Myxococcota bacterium]